MKTKHIIHSGQLDESLTDKVLIRALEMALDTLKNEAEMPARIEGRLEEILKLLKAAEIDVHQWKV